MRAVELKLETPSGLIAATAWLPDEVAPDSLPVFVAWPGGGYSKEYYDLSFPGHAGYSQAEHHTGRGAIVIGCDHLGVGASDRVGDPSLTLDEMVDAGAEAVAVIRLRLGEGTLADGLPAIPDARLLGMGQSMGGCFTILIQGRHRPFDAVAVLGYSAIHTSVHYGLEAADAAANPQLFSDSSVTRMEASALLRRGFFDPGVPEDIVAADFAGGYPLRREVPRWGSRVPQGVGGRLIQPGAVAAEARAIDCPVFLAFGEVDLLADSHAEPAAYPAAQDIELMIVPRCAHMHNFAPTRTQLWDRLVHWAARM